MCIQLCKVTILINTHLSPLSTYPTKYLIIFKRGNLHCLLLFTYMSKIKDTCCYATVNTKK